MTDSVTDYVELVVNCRTMSNNGILTPLAKFCSVAGLKQIGLPRAGAILITSTMFALIHWGAVPEYGRAAAIPALAVFGVALGVLMERTGRLWSSFIAHALFNCANIFLFSMLPK